MGTIAVSLGSSESSVSPPGIRDVVAFQGGAEPCPEVRGGCDGVGGRRWATLGVRVMVEGCGGRERLRVCVGGRAGWVRRERTPWENSVMGRVVERWAESRAR